MTINWIKCSERMPPDGADLIVKELKFDEYYNHISSDLLTQEVKFTSPNRYEWTPYTPEAWKELNND